MRLNASPSPGVRLITRYDTDIAGAAEALLAMLQRAPQPDALIPDPESRKDPGNSESTAADAA